MNPDPTPIIVLACFLATALGWIGGCAFKTHAIRRAEKRGYQSGREDARLLADTLARSCPRTRLNRSRPARPRRLDRAGAEN